MTTTTTTAKKVTLTSILFATVPALPVLAEGQTEHTKDQIDAFKAETKQHVQLVGENLAEYLINKTADTAIYVDILKAAAKAVPVALAKIEADKVAAAEKAAAELAAAELAAKEEREKAEREYQEKVNNLIKTLTDGGYDLEVAKTLASKAGEAWKPAPAAAEKTGYNRVKINVNGKEFDIPQRGNLSVEVKEIMTAENLDREALIAKYRVEPAQAETETPAAE